MKLCLAVLVLGVLAMSVIGCKAKGEVSDPDTHSGSVKVDTK